MRIGALPASVLGVAVLALAAPALAGAELVLLDGQVLSGVSVERKGDAYQLAGEDGTVMAIPAALVKEMRLTGGDAPPPTGLTFSGSETLAGLEVPAPGRREMLAAFGRPPALFRPPSGAERWTPRDGFEGKDATRFRPTRWAEPVLDPVWWPASGFRSEGGAGLRPVRWRPAVVDTTWKPRDGFGPTGWFSSPAAPPPSAE